MSAPQLRSYLIRYEHNHGYSELGVQTTSLQAALEHALNQCPRESAEFCEHFEVDMREFDYVRVTDDKTDEEIVWASPEQRKREHADEMCELLQHAFVALNGAREFEFCGHSSFWLADRIEGLLDYLREGGAR